MATLQDSLQQQNSKLRDQLAQTADAGNQRLEAVAQQASETATAVEERARRKCAGQRQPFGEAREQQQSQKQVAGDLDQLKQASSDANSKLAEISDDVSSVKGDVSSVKGDVASTQTRVDSMAPT